MLHLHRSQSTRPLVVAKHVVGKMRRFIGFLPLWLGNTRHLDFDRSTTSRCSLVLEYIICDSVIWDHGFLPFFMLHSPRGYVVVSISRRVIDVATCLRALLLGSAVATPKFRQVFPKDILYSGYMILMTVCHISEVFDIFEMAFIYLGPSVALHSPAPTTDLGWHFLHLLTAYSYAKCLPLTCRRGYPNTIRASWNPRCAE